MGATKAVIDSDVLIDFLQGLDAAAAEIDRYEDPCYSVISWMAVMIAAETDAERFATETAAFSSPGTPRTSIQTIRESVFPIDRKSRSATCVSSHTQDPTARRFRYPTR